MASVTGVEELTIDELARRTAMTARNIRAHQSRGLLPPPIVRGRTGYYGPEHIARIELIKELQTEGFQLGLIGRLLLVAEGSSEEVLRFTRELRAPFADEDTQIITAAELGETFPTDDPGVLERAVALRLLRPVDDDRYEVASPQLIRAGGELVALGIAPEQVLDVAAQLRRHSDAVAKLFVRLFFEGVWKPFERDGHSEESWPQVIAGLQRLRPLASDSLLAIFKLAMDDAVDEAFGRELRALERRPPRGRRRRRHGP